MRPKIRQIGICLYASILCGLILVLGSPSAHSALDEISRAADYCRPFKNATKLSDDAAIICFDGHIRPDLDMGPFRELKQNGYAVIRSEGGNPISAIRISDILMEKNATVVVADYCLSACANFLFVATDKTYVLKDSIVAWHGGPTKSYCHHEAVLKEDPQPIPDRYCAGVAFTERFYSRRRIDDRFVYEPQTSHTKRMLRLLGEEGVNAADAFGRHRVFWMWNPMNHGEYFKGRISYESYPASQSEVDEIVGRLRMRVRIIYDPAQ
jgi:hypothetical protein